jgi:hypothetical protein
MAATEDPVFLQLIGPGGREFRIASPRGHSFKRKTTARFVLAGPDSPETHIAHPELNDPGRPAIDLDAIVGVQIHKRLSPIPNVRGIGELDDRLLIEAARVELTAEGEEAPTRTFVYSGPIWLGLVAGHSIQLSPAPGSR